jgi:DNA polymerase-3 subunit delta'
VVVVELREKEVPPPKARLLARISGGRMGWALCACENDTLLQRREQDRAQLMEVLSGSRVERLDFAWKVSRDPADARRTIEAWTGWWRDLLLLRTHGQDHVVNVDWLDELQPLIGQSSPHQVWAVLRALQTAAAQLEANVNARLALEGLLLKLPYWRAVATSRAV